MRAYARNNPERARRDALINEHLEVARRIALRIGRRVPDWLSKDDLVSAAVVGLAEAAERYDESREEPFLGFAERRIRGAVLDELRRGDIMPRRVRVKARKVGQAIQALEQRLGRAPEDDEVAAELGIDLEEYQENLRMLTHVSMVEMTTAQGSERQFTSPLGMSPLIQAERSELIRLVREALPNMQERDALILSLYYDEDCTYREIGEVLGVSESRVCQLHTRALARLKAAIETSTQERNDG